MKNVCVWMCLSFFFMSNHCICQSNPLGDVRYNSLRLATGTISNNTLQRDSSENIGTCFVIKFKNHFYLATNYHLLTGRYPFDERTFDSVYVKGQTPNMLIVWFYDNKGRQVTKIFPLLDSKKKRLFLTPKPDNKQRVIDVAFIPIDINKLSDVIINPIDLSNIDTALYIKEQSELVVCGFRGDSGVVRKVAIEDTVRTVNDFPFLYNDRYIFCNKTIRMEGSSGSPLYYNNNNKYSLVGMLSLETNTPLAIMINEEMKEIRELKLVYEFVSISSIKKEIESLTSLNMRKRKQ